MVEIVKCGLLDGPNDCCPWKHNKRSVEMTGVASVNRGDKYEMVFTTENNYNKFPAVFSYDYDKDSQCFLNTDNGPKYYDNALVRISEDFQAITCCDDFVVVATSMENQQYGDTNIVYWHKDKKKPDFLRLCGCDSNTTCCHNSKSVWAELIHTISAHLSHCCSKCVGYIKLEGLACIESVDKMLFGISQIGRCGEHKMIKTLIVQATYKIENGCKLHLDNDFCVVGDYNIRRLAKAEGVPICKAKTLKLSDMCFDKETNHLIIVTKHSYRPDMGGYMWTVKWYEKLCKFAYSLNIVTQKTYKHIKKECINKNKCPCGHCDQSNDKLNNTELVCSEKPYEFTGRPQGVACLNNNTALVIFDNDCRLNKGYKFKYQVITYKVGDSKW